MTDAKPQEFARVEYLPTYGHHILIGSYEGAWMSESKAKSIADKINAAVATHVRRAVEEFREKVCKQFRGGKVQQNIKVECGCGATKNHTVEFALDVFEKVVRALPLEAEGK